MKEIRLNVSVEEIDRSTVSRAGAGNVLFAKRVLPQDAITQSTGGAMTNSQEVRVKDGFVRTGAESVYTQGSYEQYMCRLHRKRPKPIIKMIRPGVYTSKYVEQKAQDSGLRIPRTMLFTSKRRAKKRFSFMIISIKNVREFEFVFGKVGHGMY